MSITATIAGVSYPVRDTLLVIQQALAQRDACTLTVMDVPGTARIVDYSQVSITDSVAGLLFTGFVFSSQMSNLYPNAQNDSIVVCMGPEYLADKHYYGVKANGANDPEKINEYAGNIATELLSDYLAQEGITANYAIRKDTTQADFAAGTLVGTTSTNNVGDGDLELTTAGTTVTKVESTTANWNANVQLTGLDTAGGQLQLASHSTLKLTAICQTGYGNTYVYWQIWSGSYVIATGDILSYNVWVNSSSPMIKFAVDLHCSDGTNVRDSSQGTGQGVNFGIPDQNGLGCHPTIDLNGYANDQWYLRKITIGVGTLVGKTIVSSTVVFEGDTAGTYTGYIYDIILFATNGTTHHLDIYYGAGPHASILQPVANAKAFDNGYSNIVLTPILGYEVTGTRISNAISIAAAGIYQKSLISWVAQPLPAGTAIAISTSVDGAATMQAATNFTPIASLMPGVSLTGQTINTQQVLTLTGKDPIYTPVLNDITWSVFPSYAATKSDANKTLLTAANWTAGAVATNMQVLANNDLQPVMFTRNWDDGNIANQTTFGGTNQIQAASLRAYNLGVNGNAFANAEVRSRFDFAGSWTDFTMNIDMQFVASNLSSSFIWANTNWVNTSNGPDVYAYRVNLISTQIACSRGSNGGVSSSTPMGSAFVFPQPIVAGDWHTITVNRTGNVHTVWMDGIQVVQFTDSTYTAAGTVGVQFTNQGGNNIFHSGFFDNFGITVPSAIVGQASPPQEITNSVSLGSITVDNSIVLWDVTALPSGAIITVSALVTGGAYTPCTNGAVIPGLTPGTVLSAASVRFKIQMQTPNASAYMALNGFTWWVSSAFNATGTRISPVLSLTPVGRVGSSLIAWNANTPTGTTLGMDVSPTGGAPWTDVTSGNGSPIPLYTTQPDPWLDNFPVDDHTNYTNTFLSSGVAGTWTFDTANNRLVATGGTNAVLLYPTLSYKDGYTECILDKADQAGIGLRWTNASNSYYLMIRDDSGSAPQQTIQLWKNVAGVKSQIGSNASITFKRNTYHLFHMEMVGNAITVDMDGIEDVISTTDSSLAGPGTAFMIENGTARFYNFRIQQYGDDLTGLNIYTRQRLASTNPAVTPQVLDVTVSAHNPSIGNGALIPTTAYSFNNGNLNTISACFDDLAKKSFVPAPYLWGIDKNLHFFFQARTASPAPFAIATANGDFLVAGLNVLTNSPAYRNDQFIIGGFDTAVKTEIKLGDSQTQTWTLGYPVAAALASGVKPIITVNNVAGGLVQYPGTPQNVGVQGVDTGMDFYYAVGSTQITQDASESPIIVGQALVIIYNGTIPVTSHAFDATEQAALKVIEGGSGIVTVVESAPGLNKAASDALCTAKLTWGKIRGRTFTAGSLHSGLQTGSVVNVFCPELGLNNAVCLVSALQTTLVNVSTATNATGIQPFYLATLIEGPITIGSWTNFFANALGK